MHEWMVDNGFTPHLVVDAGRHGVEVPKEHVKDGKIVLNVSHSATRALKLGQCRSRIPSRAHSVAPHRDELGGLLAQRGVVLDDQNIISRLRHECTSRTTNDERRTTNDA